LSKHKTFAAHFSLFSGTPVCRGTKFGKHWSRLHGKTRLTSKLWFNTFLRRSRAFQQQRTLNKIISLNDRLLIWKQQGLIAVSVAERVRVLLTTVWKWCVITRAGADPASVVRGGNFSKSQNGFATVREMKCYSQQSCDKTVDDEKPYIENAVFRIV